MASNTTRCRIHQYKRSPAPNKLWACLNCGHYMPKHLEWRLAGANSICNGCGEVFRMDEAALKENEPRCANCRLEGDSIADFLSKRATQ